MIEGYPYFRKPPYLLEIGMYWQWRLFDWFGLVPKDWCLIINSQKLLGNFSSTWEFPKMGAPLNHRIFHERNHPAIGCPHWWNPPCLQCLGGSSLPRKCLSILDVLEEFRSISCSPWGIGEKTWEAHSWCGIKSHGFLGKNMSFLNIYIYIIYIYILCIYMIHGLNKSSLVWHDVSMVQNDNDWYPKLHRFRAGISGFCDTFLLYPNISFIREILLGSMNSQIIPMISVIFLGMSWLYGYVNIPFLWCRGLSLKQRYRLLQVRRGGQNDLGMITSQPQRLPEMAWNLWFTLVIQWTSSISTSHSFWCVFFV